MKISSLLLAQILVYVFAAMSPNEVKAQVRTLVIGKGGIPWEEIGGSTVGFEQVSESLALQPKQLDPVQNLLVGNRTDDKSLTNFLGHVWSLQKNVRGSFELGVNPRMWPGQWQLIDGDSSTVIRLVNIVSGSRGHQYTFDLGFPLPVNRVVFFPPARGIDEEGGLMKQRFPRAYELSATLEPEDFLLFAPETEAHTLDKVLARTFFNDQRVVDIRFPTQSLRFLRLGFSLASQKFLLGEIQVFGEGFVPVAKYSTIALFLEEPVNFGRIFWDFAKFRQQPDDAQAILVPEAPVKINIETRTGQDETPEMHYLINEFNKLSEVDKATYLRAPTSREYVGPRPGDRGEVKDDLANWSTWSSPYEYSGQTLNSPDDRRFLQIRFEIESEDLWNFGRLYSMAIEYSPLLVQELVAEVGLVGAEALTGPVEIPAGIDTTFVYELRADFGPDGRVGFDALRLNTFAPTEFIRLEMGQPLRQIRPDSVKAGAGDLVVYFPSNKIVQSNGSERLRLIFRSSLLNYSAFFLGEVFDMTGENLPQSIDSGDATPALGTDGVHIFALGPRLELVDFFKLSTPVLTPNGDHINEVLEVGLTLLGVEGATAHMGVYDLSGYRVRRLVNDVWSRGVYKEVWDGRDEQGILVPPGVYILQVKIGTARAVVEKLGMISVVY